jgi:hypothetical protein
MTKSKRQALETILPRLRKLLPHLGNDNEGEANAARLKIISLLKTAGLDWHDVTTMLADDDSLGKLFASLLANDSEVLIQLGLAGAQLFHSMDETAFADVTVDGHRNTWPLSSAAFEHWLRHQFYKDKKAAPTESGLKAAIKTLSAHAVFDGKSKTHDVHLRSAYVGGKIYIDIGDPDWQTVEISSTGWRMTKKSPVRFRRERSMTALAVPARGGSIEQLRPLVNMTEQGFILFVSWILDGLFPGQTHPILYLAGAPGTAKSTTARIARSFVDPNKVPLVGLPTTVQNLFVAVNGSYALAFDNISNISPTISDALCQIASGGGFGTRKLYRNTDQILIGGSRPVILNGLANSIARGDLADRAVLIPMTRISAETRRSEIEVWNRFETQRPQIFGALLDRVACGLRQLPNVKLERLQRMADFMKWSVATEAFPPDAFIRAYENALTEANEAVAEADPVTVAVTAFMMDRNSWTGTAAELHKELSTKDRTEAVPSTWKEWPRNVSAFGKQLRAADAILRKTAGIELKFSKASDHAKTRIVALTKIAVESTRPMRPTRPKGKPR